ncbi:MAG: hypothetical protein ACI4V7_06640 [Succinivibrionaceae bacterium]
MRFKNILPLFLLIMSLALTSMGCAGKNILVYESIETENKTKQFLPPSEGMAGLYYVSTGNSKEINSLYIDGLKVASLTDCTYIYTELPLGTHNIATDTDFKDVDFTENKNYYLYIYYGVIGPEALSYFINRPMEATINYAIRKATTCKILYDKEVRNETVQVVKDEHIPLIKSNILRFKQIVSN